MALWINHTDNPLSKDRDLEYIEKKNIVLEYRYAEGNPDRLAALAADLVRLPVDVIVTTTDQGARAASQATPTIPIVLTTGNDLKFTADCRSRGKKSIASHVCHAAICRGRWTYGVRTEYWRLVTARGYLCG